MFTISISLGQYRYSSSSSLINLMQGTTKSYKEISMTTGASADSASFKDIQVKLPTNTTFVQNQDYYFHVEIPQDINYEMNFDIQLIKPDTDSGNVYQFIKRVSITPGGTGQNSYNVVLYENLEGDTVAMVPLEYNANVKSIYNTIYQDRENPNLYYIGDKNQGYVQCTNLSHMTMFASWKQTEEKSYGVFDMTFRPIDNGFNGILLKMVREAADYNIQQTDKNNLITFGRIVDLDSFNYKLYSLANIIPTLPGGIDTLTRIGVRSHPGLVMVINGEEIRVTANGYYELDALPITSLAVVAKDYTDFFTIDYEYEISEG